MARRATQRIARKFKEYRPVLDVYFFAFRRAELEKQIRKSSEVKHLEIVRANSLLKSRSSRRRPGSATKPAVLSAAQWAALREGVFACDATAKDAASRGHRTCRRVPAAIAAVERRQPRPDPASPAAHDHGRCALLADRCWRDDTGIVLYSTKQLIRETRVIGGNSIPARPPAPHRRGEPSGWATGRRQRAHLQTRRSRHLHRSRRQRATAGSSPPEDLLRQLQKDPLAVFRRRLDRSVIYSTRNGVQLEPRSYWSG
jgi:hypothetical protein